MLLNSRGGTGWRGLLSRLGGESGSQLVEFTLILPILMMVLAGTVDFGRAYFFAMEVSSAAEAGAAYGIQNPTDTSGMNVAAALDAPDMPNLTSTASYGTECSDGSSAVLGFASVPVCTTNVVRYVEVDTTANYRPILLYPGIPSLFTLSGKSRLRTVY